MEQRWFAANLARELQHSAAAAIEFTAEEYRNIACACESERKANRWALPMLRDAAMLTVAFAAEDRDCDTLRLAVDEYKFWAPDAAAWAQELIDIF